MPSWTEFEAVIRIAVFAGVFVLMAGAETLFPRKARVKPRSERWFTSLSMVFLSNILIRFSVPVATISAALTFEAIGLGFFNVTDWPIWLELLLAIILLDFAIWAQHVATHYVPFLWALHKVHHADEDLDASSGVRFHPLEQGLSFLFKLFVIALLGAPALAVFVFELLLNASSLFNHASIRIPQRVDKILRLVIVTPDFHRVHHSVHEAETNSNFGFNLSIWDRLFHTYKGAPREGHDEMALGLDRRPQGNTASLIWSLVLPFRSGKRKS